MTVTHLDPVHEVYEPERFGEDHPMRKVTRQVAFDGGWDSTRAGKVAALFDDMAPTWTTDHDKADRYWPLADALDRGQVDLSGRVVELGSGTGLGTRLLAAERGHQVIAMDLALEMLRHAPASDAHRVQADASRLPLADNAADTIVLVNMLLFPAEVDRVLRPDGAVVWINTVGEQTPIHLPAEDVVGALGDGWSAVASRAGYGIWAVSRRVG